MFGSFEVRGDILAFWVCFVMVCYLIPVLDILHHLSALYGGIANSMAGVSKLLFLHSKSKPTSTVGRPK